MKPMLASKAPDDFSRLPYPQLASPKLDGIRCLINSQGQPVSRTLKPIRNRDIAGMLSDPRLIGLDGELIVGDPNASDCMRQTNSGVMSYDKPLRDDQWKFYVFDIWNRGGQTPFHITQERLAEYADHPQIVVVPQHGCTSPAQIEQCEKQYLDDGYEGIMLRNPHGRYKFGRSTVREGHLLKVKRFQQAEAKVVGFEPLYHNANEAEFDNLGYTKRSQEQAGKIALDTLGALLCEGPNPYNPSQLIDFRIGTGFTQAERAIYWRQRAELLGAFVTYKFFPTGSKERPRHPVFVSFRSLEDM